MYSIRHLLWWLLAGTKGGLNRGQIILALREMPRNANQLAGLLGLDYKTVRHHLDVLQKNRIIIATGEGYGAVYLLSPEMEREYDLFVEIWDRIGKKEMKERKRGG